MSTSAPPQGPPPGSRPSPARPLLERIDWAGAVRTDWLGPLRVAATILGVAAVLAVLIGLGLRPGMPGPHWTLRTTLAFLAWLWSGAFGADLTAHANLDGIDGSVGGGAVPLTITIVSLGAGAWLFRRCTAGLSRASRVLWFAVRTALLTAIPPLVVSWILYADRGDLLHLAGPTPRAHADSVWSDIVQPTLGSGQFDRLGVSSTGSFFLTLLLTLLALLATAVTRRDLLSGRPEQVRRLLVGPVVGATVLLVALIPLGMLAAVLIWVFRPAGGTHLTWHEWMNLVAAAIAFAPNLALWQLGLGSAGRIHAAASASLGSASASSDTGIRHWAASGSAGHGVWFAVALAPVLLAGTAYAVVRLARRDGPAEQRVRLLTWVISLLVVVPFLFHIASLHAHGSESGFKRGQLADKWGGVGADTDSVSAHVGAGPGTTAIFLVVLYAAVLALLVAPATRILTRDTLAGLRQRLAPVGETTLTDETITTGPAVATASTGTYQVGEVVNGWRWDGTQWVPAPQE